MKTKIFSLNSVYLLFMAISLLFACKQEDTELANLGEAKIRIINAIPEVDEISVSINDTVKTLQALMFSQSTGYENIGAGSKLIKTTTSRRSLNNSNLNFLFKNDKSYSVFVSGKISKDSLIYITLEDNLTSPSDTTAKVRFVNASPNSPNLEAIFSSRITDSIANFSSIAFRTATVYQFFRPGNYAIKIRTSGSKSNLALGANFNIVGGRVYTIWVKGLVNGNGDYQLSPALLTDN